TERRALRIVGRRGLAKPDRGVVRLVVARQERREPRRLSQHQDEQSRRHGIERAGVPDASFAQQASRTRHDVVRGDAARFVEEKDAGHKFGCVGPHPHAWPELTMSPQRSRYALGFGVEGEGPTPHLAELTMSPQRSRYALGFGVEGEGPTPHLAELTMSPQRSRY